MKLLIVSQYFWPEDFRINELAHALRARGHDVTVLTSIPNYPEGEVFPAYAEAPAAFASFDGIEVIRAPQLTRGNSKLHLIANYLSFAISASFLGPWRLRGRKFDAIFVFQTSPVTVGIPASLIAALKRAPMLMWILDCWPESLTSLGVVRGRVGKGLAGLLVRAIYARCDLLLGQSQGFRQNVARYGKEARFRHFPNWVEAVYLRPLPLADRPAADPFTILFAGNIGEAQDFPAIVAAAEQLRDSGIRFRIVGDGRDLARTHADVEARDLAHMFDFAGRHPPSAMPDFFANADALLVSLKPEPIYGLTVPGKVQTYLAAGKPILAMLDGEGAEVVNAAGAGFAVPAGDSGALASAALRMAVLPSSELQAMGASGQAFARAHYDLGKLLEQLETWMVEARQQRSALKLPARDP
ncbi:glycosyltransferase family 4 protein [Sandaracinobacter sp. RS1-74]|nr:glycosyltransferase family 4 protein [Sandaracinobacteroides sayramensis]